MPTFNGPVFSAAVIGNAMGRASPVLEQVAGQTSVPTSTSAASITSPGAPLVYAELVP
jgi:hypothetical protein